MAERIEGWVEDYFVEKGYGFIRHSPRNGIFFHYDDIVPDKVGRVVLKPGTIVRFTLTPELDRGRFRATQVENISPDLDLLDPEAYTEIGYIKKDTPEKFGFITRPDGDRLYARLGPDNFVTEGRNLIWEGGAWVQYKIGRRVRDGKVLLFAHSLTVFEPEPQPQTVEDFFLQAEEFPLCCPDIAPAPGTSVLAPSTRKLTLLEIIKQRRN